MVVIADASVVYLRHEQLLLFLKFLRSVLPFPLERRERLGYKAGNAERYLRRALFAAARICSVILGNNALRKRGDPLYILVGLVWQTVHKIQFHLVFARSEGDSRRSEYIRLGNVFVYNIAQPLAARLRRECERAGAHRGNLRHKLFRKAVGAK